MVRATGVGFELAGKAWLGLDWGRKKMELVPGRENVSAKLQARRPGSWTWELRQGRRQLKQTLEAGEVLD